MNMETFTLSGYQISWNKVSFLMILSWVTKPLG